MKYYYTILDVDGGAVHVDDEPYDTEAEADQAARSWEDDWRYGSHEIVGEKE